MFFAWASTLGVRRAAFCTGWLAGALLLFFGAAMTISRSWNGIMYTIFLRGTAGGFSSQVNSIWFILKNIWGYSGLYLVLSAIGLVLVLRNERSARRWLLVTTVIAAYVVPLAQLHDLTDVSIDKHLAYGIWFTVIVCGYACQKLIRSVPNARAAVVILCSALALAYPVADSFQAALYKQLSWSNSSAFVTALAPVVAIVPGKIDTSTQSYVARYYTKQGYNWSRWNESGLPLSLSNVPVSAELTTYEKLLRQSNYGAISLFYTTTIRGFPASMVLSPQSAIARDKILTVIAENSSATSTGEPGLAALTLALEDDDSNYRLVSVGPYSSNTLTGIFAIWEKVAP
jgi:hypothetical protein